MSTKSSSNQRTCRVHSDTKGIVKKISPIRRLPSLRITINATNETRIISNHRHIIADSNNLAVKFKMMESADPRISEHFNSFIDMVCYDRAMDDLDIVVAKPINQKDEPILIRKLNIRHDHLFFLDLNIFVAAAFEFPYFAKDILAIGFFAGKQMFSTEAEDHFDTNYEMMKYDKADEVDLQDAEYLKAITGSTAELLNNKELFGFDICKRAIRWSKYKSEQFYDLYTTSKMGKESKAKELFALLQMTAEYFLRTQKANFFESKVGICFPDTLHETHDIDYDVEGPTCWYHACFDINKYQSWFGEMVEGYWSHFGYFVYASAVYKIPEYIFPELEKVDVYAYAEAFGKINVKWEKILSQESMNLTESFLKDCFSFKNCTEERTSIVKKFKTLLLISRSSAS